MACSRRLWRSQTRKWRCGAATVEFAIIAPLLILLLFGLIEAGRLMMVRQALAMASYEGARRASLADSKETDVRGAVERSLKASGLRDATVTITPGLVGISHGQVVEVTVSIDCADVSWTQSFLTAPNRKMVAKTAARCEGAS